MKWSCDRSSDQSQYKQNLKKDGKISEYMFMISMLSLLILTYDNNFIIWDNDRPSTRCYRAVKLNRAVNLNTQKKL